MNKRVLFAPLLWTAIACADDTNQQPEDFVAEAFNGGSPPAPSVLWINNDIQAGIRPILGHDLTKLRLVYWTMNGRSVWILDEIGKERPITAGFVVHDRQIESVKVLVYRESRGWEVRHRFFTDQFKGVGLKDDTQLDHAIDNISGATLSVHALNRMARLALFLDRHYAGP